MTERVIALLLKRPVAVAMVHAALIAGGGLALAMLPINVVPQVEFPFLSVHTTWPGVSAETVEMQITARLEEVAGMIEGARSVCSVSREGYSRVDIEFGQGTRMQFARLELVEKIAALFPSFPVGVRSPEVEPFVLRDFREIQGVVRYSLTGEMTAASLRVLAHTGIVPRLRTLRGVSEVRVEGGEDREVEVVLDPRAMNALGIRTDEVVSALANIESNQPVGSRHEGGHRISISVRNMDMTQEEIARVPVEYKPGGALVLLGEIGSVALTASEPYSYVRINGRPCVSIVIIKDPKASTLQVAETVSTLMAELQARLPSGVRLAIEFDKSATFRAEAHRLHGELVLSLISILTVLAAFMGNLKAPGLVISTIGFSLAGTLLAFMIFGVGLSLFSFAGLLFGFGRIVDDSIVVLDSIQRRGESCPSTTTISEAISPMVAPVVASTIATIGALMPMTYFSTTLKPYLSEFAVAVTLALLFSLAVSFSLIPVVSARVRLDPILPNTYAWFDSHLTTIYSRVLHSALSRRWLVLAILIWVFGLPLWTLPETVDGTGIFARAYNAILGSSLYKRTRSVIDPILGGSIYLFFTRVRLGEVPRYAEETVLLVVVKFPPGSDLHECDQVARRIESEIATDDNCVGNVTTKVTSHVALVRISLPESLAFKTDPFLLKSRLTALVAQFSGVSAGVWGFGPGFTSGEQAPPTFFVKVLGYNYTTVKEIAAELSRRLKTNPRVTNVDIDRSLTNEWTRTTEIVAKVNREEAMRRGVTVSEVVKTLHAMAPEAIAVKVMKFHGDRFPVVVKNHVSQVYRLCDLLNSVVTNEDGWQARLGTLLDVSERPSPGEILREDQSYVRWVSFEYRGPYRLGAELGKATIQTIELPHGYRFDQTFSESAFSESDESLMIFMPLVALGVVFMLIAALYESFWKPLLIILAVPFSLVGLFLAFSFADTSFGLGGYTALVLLIGIVTTNSIVLVDALSRPSRSWRTSESIIIAAATSRLRPVLMTTLTTIAGSLPMLLHGDRNSVWFELALGTSSGLMSSMVLTLVVIPVGFSLGMGRKRNAG